ncbi:hypothetical protein HAX54_012281 [Datura stramonium]|uniref:Uncharacterized protein n=1 Tax=Datura stramonium TaxID=4076 RepID=A0ABS8RY39_DATST|nr:hypothetical protein [Datura stramonium]
MSPAIIAIPSSSPGLLIGPPAANNQCSLMAVQRVSLLMSKVLRHGSRRFVTRANGRNRLLRLFEDDSTLEVQVSRHIQLFSSRMTALLRFKFLAISN